MKKNILLLALIFISTNIFAQYKKASFFNKDGKVYELGVIKSFFPDAAGKQPLSIVFTNAVESGEKKFSAFQEIEFMLKSKLTYFSSYYSSSQSQTTSGNVTATRLGALIVKYGGQYRFVNLESENTKLEPYIRAGLIFGFNFGGDDVRDSGNETVSPDVYPSDVESIIGIEGGAGVSYFVTKNFGIRAGAFYRVSGNEGMLTGDNAGVYNTFKSNYGFSLSLKYRLFSED